MWMKDEGWSNILQRLQVGKHTRDDMDKVDKFVVTNPHANLPNFQTLPSTPSSPLLLVTIGLLKFSMPSSMDSSKVDALGTRYFAVYSWT
ncbi:hypothetical protein BDZ94DRAFT_1255607 [Collybia nuda]|uniref:Uncharacterized protein n=1 Tax=Collybia nuda TaxID=64659 RepID=A0A9P5Y7A5_9AGAR|nr:hypothetical protein BDZ94DRAFT_1255607 [Collybia nuda]